MAYKTGPKLVTSGLQMCLDASDKNCYSGTGTSMTELVSNYNDGYQALVNGPTFSTENAGVIVLDGSNDYITVKQIDSQLYTICLWVKFDTVANDANHVIIRQGYSPANYGLYLINGVLNTYGVGSGGNHLSSTSITLSAGNWYNIVYIKNWTLSKEAIYINGVLEYGLSDFSAGTYSFNNSSQSYNYTDLGRNVNNNNSFVDGRYASLLIYNRLLGLTEIKQNFDAQRAKFRV